MGNRAPTVPRHRTERSTEAEVTTRRSGMWAQPAPSQTRTTARPDRTATEVRMIRTASRSAAEELRLRRAELRVRQRAGRVQVGKLLELRRKIRSGWRGLLRSHLLLHRRDLLLLVVGGLTLRLFLGRHLLTTGPPVIDGVRRCGGRSGHHGGAGDGAEQTRSASSHHGSDQTVAYSPRTLRVAVRCRYAGRRAGRVVCRWSADAAAR